MLREGHVIFLNRCPTCRDVCTPMIALNRPCGRKPEKKRIEMAIAKVLDMLLMPKVDILGVEREITVLEDLLRHA